MRTLRRKRTLVSLAQVKKAAFKEARSDAERMYLTSIFDEIEKVVEAMRMHCRKRGIAGKVARAVIVELQKIGKDVE